MKLLTMFFALLLFLIFGCSQNGIELRYKFGDSKEFRYRLTSTVKKTLLTDGDGEDIHENEFFDAIIVLKTRSNDSGKTWISIKYDSIYIEGSGGEDKKKISEALKSSVPVLLFSDYGDISNVKDKNKVFSQEGLEFDVIKLFIKAFPVLPQTKISKDYSWDREQEYPIENGLAKGRMKVYKKYKVASIENIEEKTIVKLKNSVLMKTIFANSKEFSLNYKKGRTQGLFGSGTILFNTTKGMIQKSNASISGVVSVKFKHPISGKDVVRQIKLSQKLKVELI